MNYRAEKKSVLLGALFNDLTTTIVAALGAYTVIHHGSAAVGAYAQRGNGSKVVRTSFVSSLLGEFVFRMCHCLYLLIVLFAFKKSFQSGERAVRGSLLVPTLPATQKPDGVGIAFPFRMDSLQGQ